MILRVKATEVVSSTPCGHPRLPLLELSEPQLRSENPTESRSPCGTSCWALEEDDLLALSAPTAAQRKSLSRNYGWLGGRLAVSVICVMA